MPTVDAVRKNDAGGKHISMKANYLNYTCKDLYVRVFQRICEH